MSNQSVRDAGESKRYWTQIPNVVFDLGLKPLEVLLYAYLKRAAGAKRDGQCTKSTDTLVRETGMGAGTISRAKAELAKRRPDLKNKALITIREIPNLKGGKPHQHITIVDIWKINMERFATSLEEIEVADQVPVEVEASSKPTSRVEIKKNTQEEPNQEKPKTQRARAGAQKPQPRLGSDSMAKVREKMLALLEEKIGPLATPGKEGNAVKWLIEHDYSPDECAACLEYLMTQEWRTSAIGWGTVQKEIGNWVRRGSPEMDEPDFHPRGNGHYTPGVGERLTDDGVRYTVMGFDGTPTKRWSSPLAFAEDMNLSPEDTEKLRLQWNADEGTNF